MPSQVDGEDDSKNPTFTMKKDDAGTMSISGDATTTTNQLLTFANVPLSKQGSTEVKEFSVLMPEQWQYVAAASFTNSWVNLGTGYSKTGYYKRADGTVEMKISMANGTLNVSAFTLPVQYRPASPIYVAAIANGVLGILIVDPSGTVTPFAASNASFRCNFSFTAADPRPFIPSCFPINVGTKFTDPPAGVVAISSQPQNETVRVNGGLILGLDWTFKKLQKTGVITINNLTGAPYGKRTLVRVLIIGA